MNERLNNEQAAADEAHYQLLKLLEQEPHLSQRELAERLGVSLGKVNYCLKALIKRGWLKAGNFVRSDKKSAYLYLLTPSGVKERAAMAIRFLRQKEQEHEALLSEIKYLREEVAGGQRADVLNTNKQCDSN